MASERLSTTRTIETTAEAVFAVLADPAEHATLDGTGWVRDPLDRQELTREGQIFRMAMYHDNHPDKNYEMANKVVLFDPPRAIAWQPGQAAEGTDELQLGGWVWRYDLTPGDAGVTTVTLSYDWSAVPAEIRQFIQFPPFGPEYLDESLQHLAEILQR
jgi:hypothetical protein